MTEVLDSSTGEVLSLSYRRSPELGELFAALAKAQGTFTSVEKAGENLHFKSKYTTLDAVVSGTRDGLVANDLAIIQMPGNIGDNVAVTTLLGHVSGQWIESTIYVAPIKFDAQGVGSVITYLRRYGRMAMLGLAPEDDDGEAAVRSPDRPLGRPRPNPRRVSAFSTGHTPPPAVQTVMPQGFTTAPREPVAPKIDAKAPAEPADDDLVRQAWESADEGTRALQDFWDGSTAAPLRRARVKGDRLLDQLKERAADRDQLHELAGETA